jgi:cell division protein FtsQ
MWHKPQLMTAISDLLLLAAAAALLVAGLLWALRLPLFPLRQVLVAEAPTQVQRVDIERALRSTLRGNFFSVDLDAVRESLEKLPWVRRADVRRRWPNRVELRLEEHRPVARWGEGNAQLVNSYGEVFYAAGAANEAAMPIFSGPQGAAPEVLKRHGEFTRALAAIGRQPRQINLSARLAWQLKLDDGMLIELGREQPKATIGDRLDRFVAAYPQIVAGRQPRALAADLRYPNGFALRTAGATGGETRGKT